MKIVIWQELLMHENKISEFINQILYMAPQAYALLKGGSHHPGIHGVVYFYEADRGTLILTEVWGLPDTRKDCPGGFFGFHIHEGGSCEETMGKDPFAGTGGHYNPGNCLHPGHAGDLPPLLGNHGFAWGACYTERFMPKEIVNRSVVIHDMPDDFKSQPAGNAGEKIACGVIAEY